MRQGWDPRYKIWVEHGEPAPPTPPPVIDNTRQPLMSDMTALLNDLSYIPPNNEHNEPTQGDIGETSNEPTQATRNEFEELYASANEELYPGCDYVTRLDFMAKFTYFKAKGRLTDSIFNEMLEFFQNVFPISKGFKLPPSYYAIKKTFKTIGLGYESIHACEHDCCLFRGDNNKDLDFCPVCNTSRWKDSNTPGKKVPKKVLRYFPIIPRLQRLYKSSHTAKEMIWHATGKCTEPGKMQHPVDGGAWKKFDTKYPDFAKEPRNVRLGLAADGFNPFGNLSQAYNMWPVILTTYNLPPWLCMKESSFMLMLLIPGPKSPGKDIDVYLRPLIEDLKVLWDRKGVETIDVASGQKFNMRAMVLWTINDFPARSSLSGWSGQGYKACPTCNEDTPYVRVLSKIAYVGHKRFLKKPHKWRSSREFNGQTDNRDPPKEFGRDKILAQLDRLPTRLTGKTRLAKVGHSKWLVARPNQKQEVLEALGCVFFHASSLFPNKDMKEEFPDWFGPQIRQRHVDNDKDPEVSTTRELFALACGPTWTPISVNSCVVDGVRYVVYSRDERHTTQNSGICSPGPDEEMYYGQLQEILEFKYLLFKVVLFRVKWFDTRNQGRKVKRLVLRNNIADAEDLINVEMMVVRKFYSSEGRRLILKLCQQMLHRSHGVTVLVMMSPHNTLYPRLRVWHALITKAKVIEIHFGRLGITGRLNYSDRPETFAKGDAECVVVLPLLGEGPEGAEGGDHFRDWGQLSFYVYFIIVTCLTSGRTMDSSRVDRDSEGNPNCTCKSHNTNKASFKAKYWKADPTTGSYDLEAIRRARPEEITAAEWDKYIKFWNDPKNLARAARIRLNRQKRVVISRQGSRSLARLRDEMRQASDTQEYPSLIDTFWRTHTVDGVFPKDEDRRIYEEMKRLEATGEYTEDEINALARGGKLRGHIPGVGRVLPSRATSSISDSKYSDMFKEFESGGASGSGGCGDDEEGGDDEDGDSDD
ncbi:retrovirus-related pol polyprotein from transposon 17.6 [Tanacetum coccineum]